MSESEASLGIFSSGPLLVVLSGPSGAGKDAILSRLKESALSLFYVVTFTTRPRRPGEADGHDYHFVSSEKFRDLRDEGELLEWAEVYGHLYGVPKEPLRQALSEGRDVVLKVDIQGATTIKKILPQAVFIFIMPSSLEELRHRLEERGTESDTELTLRVEKAQREIESWPLFDYIVVNRQGKIDLTLAKIEAIITAEKCRTRPRILDLARIAK